MFLVSVIELFILNLDLSYERSNIFSFLPSSNQRKHLEIISKAADAISDGNLVERLIRSDQSWSLLPLQVSKLRNLYSCCCMTERRGGGGSSDQGWTTIVL